ncbi:MAG: hypothetical protein JWM07_54 [Candidatus Saccharibacteria bacterium]|nr:hypothetical protein [Candidatus Saccharibacteria bacterium]
MSLETSLCIVHRRLIPPEGKVGTRIRFKTSMPGRYFDQEKEKIRTFEATLSDISTQRDLDVGAPQYGFVLDKTPDSAAIITEFRRMYVEDCKSTLETWADDPKILPLIQEQVSKPPVFRLETSAQYIFAEGDRVKVSVCSPRKFPIYEPLGDIVQLEVIC